MPGTTAILQPRTMVAAKELLQAIGWTIRAEFSKRRAGPGVVVRSFRASGLTARSRSPKQRARLRRMIHLLDRFFPSGPNCYRRALVEMAMDAGAAREPLYLGLNLSPRPTGHAWLSSDSPASAYEAELRI